MPHLTDANRSTLMKRRAALGLSQRALASKMGTTAATVSRIEQGIKHPSDDMLSRLADALGLDVSVTTTVRIRVRKLPASGH